MNAIQGIFHKRQVVAGALEPFGFRRTDAGYVYEKTLPESGFVMSVTLAADGGVYATLSDPSFNEPYTLHLAEGATGSFVGGVRSEYEQVLTDIAERCFAPDVFKSAQAKELISYVRDAYGDELEFLWKKFPDNAVWRRSDTAKWYGALLTVSERKLGKKSDDTVEIIDLRIAPRDIEGLIDNKNYFPGWHMNKNSWYTIILDGSVPSTELKQRIDESYMLAIK